MRIRKHPRNGNAEPPQEDHAHFSILKVVDWCSQRSSETDTYSMDESGSDGRANSTHKPIAALAVQDGHGGNDADLVKPDPQPRNVQEGNSSDFDAADEVHVPSDQSRTRDQLQMSVVKKGVTRSSMSSIERRQSVSDETDSPKLSLSLLVDKAHHSNSIKLSSSMYTNNATRHYVRRSLRKGGDSVPGGQAQTATKDISAGAWAPKVDSSGHSSHIPRVSIKKELHTFGAAYKRKLPKSEPCLNPNEEQDHPSRAPEGSLLHSMYLQLLAVGREGITYKELIASFISQTSLRKLPRNWREKVKVHLKNDPYFEQVKGRYLLCEHLVQPISKRVATKELTSHDMDLGPKSTGSKAPLKTDHHLQSDFTASPTAPPMSISNDAHKGVQTRQKAYQKTVEAVLSESVKEFHKMQQDKVTGVDVGLKSSKSLHSHQQDSVVEKCTETRPKPAQFVVSKKRKSLDEEQQLPNKHICYEGAIPGSLKALQAKIIAEIGLQNGVRCARKDGSNDSSKWQCPMMAMDGHTLCEHHKFLNERKKARYANARKQGEGQVRHLQVKSMDHESDLSKRHLRNEGPTLSALGIETHKSDEEDVTGVAGFESKDHINMRSDSPLPNAQEVLHTTDNCTQVVEKSKVGERGRISQKLMLHSFKSAPKARFVAAKKTAAESPSVSTKEKTKDKQSTPLIRTPTIPPLPALYGVRRKKAKNRSLLSL